MSEAFSDAAVHAMRSGELVAYRASRGQGQWEWRLTGHELPSAVPSGPAPLLLPQERVA